MDGCPTFHFAPQMPARSKLLRGLCFLFSFVSIFTSIAKTSFAVEPPVMAPASQEEWAAANATKAVTIVQIVFPNNIFDRDKDWFSELLAELPLLFPKYKLNTIGRGIHSTLAYQDEISLEEAKEVMAFFKSLDRATLEEYDLIRPVKVLDPEHLEFLIVGTKTPFVAVRPHREYIDWQVRWYKLMRDKAPAVYRRHLAHGGLGESLVSAEGVHFSLIQGVPAAEQAQVIQKLQAHMGAWVKNYIRRHEKAPQLIFDLSKTPIQMTMPAASLVASPTPIVTLKLDSKGNPVTSQIGLWSAETDSDDVKKVIEFDIEKFLSGAQTPYVPGSSSDLGFGQSAGKAVNLHEALAQLTPKMRRVVEIEQESGRISPTRMPRLVESSDARWSNRFYTTAVTDSELNPAKGFEALETTRKLGLRSTENTSIGMWVYASSVNDKVKNPGDIDTLINTLVHVPSSIQTREEADRYAARKFVEDTIGQFNALTKQKKIAQVELRLSSDEAMGLNDHGDPIEGREANPYWPEQQILNDQCVDKNGRVRSLVELVLDGEFMKGKIDYFDESGVRHEISVQFLLAYSWQDSVYPLQRMNLKGIPPQVRTGVADGVESAFLGATMQRAFEYYIAQKGSVVARAIRDTVKAAFGHGMAGEHAPIEIEPVWSPKFVKKFYRFVKLLNKGGLHLDAIFFEETKRILMRDGKWAPNYSLSELLPRVMDAINQENLSTLNRLKRNINDFREYNERGQRFRDDQWISRQKETRELVLELEKILKDGDLIASEPFLQSFREFKKHFATVGTMVVPEHATSALLNKALGKVFLEFENQMTLLEGHLVGHNASIESLPAMDKIFIANFSAYSPYFFFRYILARGQDSEEKMRWHLRFMGVEPSETNLRSMIEVSRNLDTMSKAEIAKHQIALFGKSKGPCSSLLSEPEVHLLGD